MSEAIMGNGFSGDAERDLALSLPSEPLIEGVPHILMPEVTLVLNADEPGAASADEKNALDAAISEQEKYAEFEDEIGEFVRVRHFTSGSGKTSPKRSRLTRGY
jgi:hypothetical protein